jgi:hypothetical protein
MSPADIMDTGLKGGDLAVRLAIGESQVQEENKVFFSKFGINLDVLESLNSHSKSLQRSNTTLLIKNLPGDAQKEELESMLARYRLFLTISLSSVTKQTAFH